MKDIQKNCSEKYMLIGYIARYVWPHTDCISLFRQFRLYLEPVGIFIVWSFEDTMTGNFCGNWKKNTWVLINYAADLLQKYTCNVRIIYNPPVNFNVEIEIVNFIII